MQSLKISAWVVLGSLLLPLDAARADFDIRSLVVPEGMTVWTKAGERGVTTGASEFAGQVDVLFAGRGGAQERLPVNQLYWELAFDETLRKHATPYQKALLSGFLKGRKVTLSGRRSDIPVTLVALALHPAKKSLVVVYRRSGESPAYIYLEQLLGDSFYSVQDGDTPRARFSGNVSVELNDGKPCLNLIFKPARQSLLKKGPYPGDRVFWTTVEKVGRKWKRVFCAGTVLHREWSEDRLIERLVVSQDTALSSVKDDHGEPTFDFEQKARRPRVQYVDPGELFDLDDKASLRALYQYDRENSSYLSSAYVTSVWEAHSAAVAEEHNCNHAMQQARDCGAQLAERYLYQGRPRDPYLWLFKG